MNTENRAYPKFSTARPVTAARATQPSRKLTVRHTGQPRGNARERLNALLEEFHLQSLAERFA